MFGHRNLLEDFAIEAKFIFKYSAFCTVEEVMTPYGSFLRTAVIRL